MGADQSSQPGTSLKSQRDEDIPYTSCSISKPIGVVWEPERIGKPEGSEQEWKRSRPISLHDQPKSSPRLMSKTRSTSRDAREQSTSQSIIVVTEGASSEPQVDEELVHLSAIAPFLPLIHSSVSASGSVNADALGQLDVRHILNMCLRLQEHMKQCADAVAFDQNALCVRIKEVDYIVQTLYHNLTERQKRFAKYAEQIQKVNEVSTILSRIQMNIEQTVPLMERLNSVLPAEEQLEPFTLKPPK